MTLRVLIFRYILFAIIAIIANLCAQRIILQFGESIIFFGLAVLFGTAAGLVCKYILDKRWIYYDLSTGFEQHSKKFITYTVMGIITTLIFWSTETIFWLVWKSDIMRELGAVLGLSVGYFIKYHLDSRYVFTNSARIYSR